MDKFTIKNEFSFTIKNQKNSEILNEISRIAKASMYKISETAPSDNDLELTIQNQDDQCLVTIRLLSSKLKIFEQSLAKSPLVAIEVATKKALDKVRSWSQLRTLDLESSNTKVV